MVVENQMSLDQFQILSKLGKSLRPPDVLSNLFVSNLNTDGLPGSSNQLECMSPGVPMTGRSRIGDVARERVEFRLAK